MTIDEYVDQVVAGMAPLGDEQIEAAARILVGVEASDGQAAA